MVDFYAQRYSTVVKFAATPVARGRGAAAAYHAACVVAMPRAARQSPQGVTREQRSKFRRVCKSKSKKQTKNPPSSPNPSIARSPPTPTIPITHTSHLHLTCTLCGVRCHVHTLPLHTHTCISPALCAECGATVYHKVITPKSRTPSSTSPWRLLLSPPSLTSGA